MLKLPKLPPLAFSALSQLAKLGDAQTLPLLRTVHAVSRKPLEALGFRWERRLEGEAGLGMWRLDLRKKSAKNKRSKTPTKNLRRFVLIPGFGDTSLSWAGVLAMLAPVLWKRYDEIVLLDFPGWHGFLSQERAFESVESLFRATDDVLDSLKPTTILGHSLGGWVAAQYAASCGEGKRPVARAADKTPTYSGPEELILCAPAGMYGEADELAKWRSNFERAIEEGFHAFRPRLFHREPLWFRFMAGEFKDFMAREDIIQFLKSANDDQMLMDRASSITARTWVVWGDRDELSPSSWSKVWLRRLGSTAQAVTIPGVGHSLQSEKPALVAALLTQLLLGKQPHLLGKRWWQLVPKESTP